MAKIVVEMTKKEYDTVDKGEVFVDESGLCNMEYQFHMNLKQMIRNSIKTLPGQEDISVLIEIRVMENISDFVSTVEGNKWQ